MALIPGTRLGVYEVTAQIGVGGMGEVYQATDTNLKRQVAIKVLPASVAGDADRLVRFQREAEVLAALNHPNIAAIYGLERTADFTALVLELVVGDDLSQRIARGAIPLDEALPIAKQIADALEAAHEQGIIHRDLKPANIKVRAEGAVKVLDFGLAKAMESGGAGRDNLSMSPTITTPAMTQAGIILGTAAYMSPEQARGKTVDRRSDIWAYGVVLYEMLTGRAAFAGETITDVLAAIVTREPDWTAVPAATPESVRQLLARCLDRDPKTRLRDIGEARVALATIANRAPDVPNDPVPRAAVAGRQARLAWVSLAATAVVALIAVGVAWFRPPAVLPAVASTRFAFVPPENLTVDDVGFDDIIVSPDGTKLVFTAREGDGVRQLWLRSLDALDARPLPDTEDAIEPFWSPDSQSVGFASAGKLRRVDIAGRRAETLADAARLNAGSSWSRDGVIVFNPDYGKGLFQVPATGGPATELRTPGQGPCFLPDGRHFIYTKTPGSVFVGSLDSATDVPLQGVTSRVFYTANPFGSPRLAGGATGWLIFVRNAVLMTQPFDAVRLALAGEPIRVATDPAASEGLSEPRRFVSVSDTGVMVLMMPQARDYQLVWVDRAGRQLGTLGPVMKTTVPTGLSISPDGNRVVMQRRDPKTPGQDIWVSDLSRGTLDRVTTGPVNSQAPVWSSDGRQVFFETARDRVTGIYQVAATGGDAKLVIKGTLFPNDVSPDGRFLLYFQRGQSTRMDLWALPIARDRSSAGDGQPHPLLNSQFDELAADLSPDGRWLAYASDVTGIEEVYVRPFSADDGKVGEPIRVSIGSGTRPRWRQDGAELFYLAAPQAGTRVQMMSVRLKNAGTALQIATPSPLFTTRMFPSTVFTDYDVTSDGQRFLVGTILDAPNATRPSAVVVLNWTAGLQK